MRGPMQEAPKIPYEIHSAEEVRCYISCLETCFIAICTKTIDKLGVWSPLVESKMVFSLGPCAYFSN